eukprot:Em0005g1224a
MHKVKTNVSLRNAWYLDDGVLAGQGLHLDPAEFQIAVIWWLGMNSSIQSVCPFCPDITLDPLDIMQCLADMVVMWLSDTIACETSSQSSVGMLTCLYEWRLVRQPWQQRPKCLELGWSCIPLAVETYGNWGKQAHDTFSRLASFLAIHQSSPKAVVVAEIYGRLNVVLVRSIARAILARELPPS